MRYFIFFSVLFLFSLSTDAQYVLMKCISGDCQSGTGVAEFENLGNKNDGKVIYKGSFRSGKMDGEGIMADNNRVYFGGFERNGYKGHGIEFYSKKINNENVPDSSFPVQFGDFENDSVWRSVIVYVNGDETYRSSNPNGGKKFNASKAFKDDWIDQHVNDFVHSRSEIFAKIKSAEAKTAEARVAVNENSASPNTRTSGGNIEKLTVRRTCPACHGSGKTGHNETQSSYIGGKEIKTMKVVYETCGTCHGAGVL